MGFLSSRKCSKRRIYLMTVNFRMRCRMKGARLEWDVAAFGHVNRVVAAYERRIPRSGKQLAI